MASPLEHQTRGPARPREGEVGSEAHRHLDAERLDPRQRGRQVVDLHCDRVHTAAEPLDERGHRRPFAVGRADLDGVVADPGHPTVAPDRLHELLAVQHAATEQPGQRIEDPVVVGAHGGGVEHPADVGHARRLPHQPETMTE
jgi:hypothetical protein